VYGQVALTRESQRFTQHSLAMGYWWDVYATPMGEPAERRIAILFTDITARTKSEAKLRDLAAHLSESNRHKTEFLATLAHELRNPLAPMRTGLDLIRMPNRSVANSGKVLAMMDRQLNQIVHLIDDLMDIARISSGKIVLKKERVDLKVAVADAVEASLQAIEAAHHELQVNLPAQAVFLDVDRTRLAQILSNLLTNAAKYTADGGKITLSVAQQAGSVTIAITDTGIGIPAEEQSHVFDMFSQVSRNMGRAQGGLGIGLSLVRSLVEMHEGTIEVASPGVGQGTTFTVSFPAAPDGPADSLHQPAVTEERPDAIRLRVLIADDNADAAHLLCDLFQALGHTTEAAYNGIEACEKIINTRPDLALLDIGMPGLNGYEVARKIKRMPDLDHVMLVALTGWGGALDRHQSESAGFDAHLTKPAGMSELNLIIEKASNRLKREG
jgi:signal transduction histidine kinase/ActR/RegA family two-component response regulator